MDLAKLDPERFDMVVIDEFHHALAPSYDRLLKHLKPKVLLGLTATPERADGRNVTDWFGGRARIIAQAVRNKVTSIAGMRALGFCVGVAQRQVHGGQVQCAVHRGPVQRGRGHS